jgi:hypothetical protein
MRKKILVLLLVLCLSVPIVLAADYAITYNSGDEPFELDPTYRYTGIQRPSLVNELELTNTGTNPWYGGGLGGGKLLFFAFNLTKDGLGDRNKQLNISYVWVDFVDHHTATHRGWLNLTDVGTTTGSAAFSPGDEYFAVSLTNVTFNSAVWVSTENGHTAGTNPTLGYLVENGEEVHFQVFWEADTDKLTYGDYEGESGMGMTAMILYYT